MTSKKALYTTKFIDKMMEILGDSFPSEERINKEISIEIDSVKYNIRRHCWLDRPPYFEEYQFIINYLDKDDNKLYSCNGWVDLHKDGKLHVCKSKRIKYVKYNPRKI